MPRFVLRIVPCVIDAVFGVRRDNLGNIKRAIGSAMPGLSNHLSSTVIRQVTVLSTIVCRNCTFMYIAQRTPLACKYNRQRHTTVLRPITSHFNGSKNYVRIP